VTNTQLRAKLIELVKAQNKQYRIADRTTIAGGFTFYWARAAAGVPGAAAGGLQSVCGWTTR